VQGRGVARWWAASLVEHDRASGAWIWGSGEIVVDRRHPPFLKDVGRTPSPCPFAYRGNPRTCLSSSIVIITFLLEGVAWYAAHQSAKNVVGILRRALGDIFIFVDPILLTLVSLLFLLGLLVLRLRQLYCVVAILICRSKSLFRA
jgi:hypothetical protein